MRGQSPPESAKVTRAGDDHSRTVSILHVVDAHTPCRPLDCCLSRTFARHEHLAVAPREAAQVEDVRVEPDARYVDAGDARARDEEVAASVARDEPRHRRVVAPQTDDDILERRHPLALDLADGSAEHLREIEHVKLSPPYGRAHDSTRREPEGEPLRPPRGRALTRARAAGGIRLSTR